MYWTISARSANAGSEMQIREMSESAQGGYFEGRTYRLGKIARDHYKNILAFGFVELC